MPVPPTPPGIEVCSYDDRIVRWFVYATSLWGFIGMTVGALIALQLPFWQANLGEYLSFGRLRPLHTNAVIFAFAGNAIFAAIYYSSQRLCKARMFSDLMSCLHFWGWQAIIVFAAITLPLGLSTREPRPLAPHRPGARLLPEAPIIPRVGVGQRPRSVRVRLRDAR